jgi:uncharacterized protein (TIGR02266 family)
VNALNLEAMRAEFRTFRRSPAEVANEEASIEAIEVSLTARLGELRGLGAASASRFEEARQELTTLLCSDASVEAKEVLDALPAQCLPTLPFCPERERADVARRAAIKARRKAAVTEQRAIERFEKDLATADQAMLKIQGSLETTRAIALARAKTVKAEWMARRLTPAPAVLGRERRQHARVSMQTEVDLCSDSNFYSGYSTDLSDGGLFVATYNVVDIDTEIQVAFTLPTGQRIVSQGVTRWVREYNEATPQISPGVGVEFVGMPAETKEAIGAFTSTREPMFWS